MNCQEVARIVSEMKDRPVSWRARLTVHLHLAMCRMCQTYRKQLDLISRVSRAAGDLVMDRSTSTTMSEDAKERIKQKLSGQR
jgi:hypothetical protein